MDSKLLNDLIHEVDARYLSDRLQEMVARCIRGLYHPLQQRPKATISCATENHPTALVQSTQTFRRDIS